MTTSTIFALASGPGRAGVAVLRLSGPDAISLAERLAGRHLAPRRAVRTCLLEPAGGEVLDDGLAIAFPGPNSYTGEDVAELHVHGGPAVLDAVCGALAGLGARQAEPGEFTRRAFENGKMDLTRAEAVADIVAAETSAQRRQALRQLDGALGDLYEAWRGTLIEALAHMEAVIDFSDEDLPPGVEDSVWESVTRVEREVVSHLADGHRGERLRDGMAIAILGAPNAGKSSLLNRLARRDAAIVSETAGTTRDVIEVRLDLGGYPVFMADTAGLREARDDIEREGVRRALARADAADVKLAVFDATAWPEVDPATAEVVDKDTVVVVNKIDLERPAGALSLGQAKAHPISAKTGEGMDELLGELAQRVSDGLAEGSSPALTRARHRQALEEAAAGLARMVAMPRPCGEPELAAEELRLAARAMGRVTGRFDVEDLLDVIFRDFCLGK